MDKLVIPNWQGVLTHAYSVYAMGAAFAVQILDFLPILDGVIPKWVILALLAWGFVSRFIPQKTVTNPEAAPLIKPVVSEPKYDEAV